MKTKTLLQVAVALGACVPILAGLSGVIYGQGMLGEPHSETIFLNNHYRYLSGLLLGIGFSFWSLIPHIERKTAQFQLLAVIVAIGGLSRLYGVFLIGVTDKAILFSLGMELVVTPLLALWQRAVAAAHNR